MLRIHPGRSTSSAVQGYLVATRAPRSWRTPWARAAEPGLEIRSRGRQPETLRRGGPRCCEDGRSCPRAGRGRLSQGAVGRPVGGRFVGRPPPGAMRTSQAECLGQGCRRSHGHTTARARSPSPAAAPRGHGRSMPSWVTQNSEPDGGAMVGLSGARGSRDTPQDAPAPEGVEPAWQASGLRSFAGVEELCFTAPPRAREGGDGRSVMRCRGVRVLDDRRLPADVLARAWTGISTRMIESMPGRRPSPCPVPASRRELAVFPANHFE